MRILYIMNHVDKGGAALALLDLVKELKRKHGDQLQIVVVTGRKNKLNAELTKMGVQNFSAPFKNFMSTPVKPYQFWRIALRIRHDIFQKIAIKKLEDRIDFTKVDVIHTNLNRIDIGAILAQKYRIPHFWHLREYRWGSFNMLSIFDDEIAYMNSFKSVFVGISNAVLNNWIEYGLEDNSCGIVYDGIEVSDTTFREKKNGELVLKCVCVGGYSEVKGQAKIIEAIALLPEEDKHRIHIDFYGNGTNAYINFLKEKVKELKLQNCVSFYGYDPNIREKLLEYDVGINATNNEGFGRATVEYMLAGLCPLVCNRGANQEIVADMCTGVVYNYDEMSELAQRLSLLLRDSELLSNLRSNAREAARDRYSIEEHANQIYLLYEEILKDRKALQ